MQVDAVSAIDRDGQTALGAEERLVLHAHFVGTFNDDVTLNGLVAVTDHQMSKYVALWVDSWCGDGCFGVDEGLEQLVVDHDRRCGPPSSLGVIGGNCGDGLAVETDHIMSEHRLVLVFEPVGLCARYVVLGDDRMHTYDLPGCAEIDRGDPGRRVWRAKDVSPQH